MNYSKHKTLDPSRTIYSVGELYVSIRIVQTHQDIDGDDVPDFLCVKSSGCVCDEDGGNQLSRVPEKVRSISLSALSEGTLDINSELNDVTQETIERVLKLKAAHEALAQIPTEESN